MRETYAMPARKILVIDNYDSFVFNLVQYLGQLGAECTVVRNDHVVVEEADKYDGVLISPGPGTPERAGVSVAMVKYCAEKKIPLFGVCLGHQAIAVAYGAKVSQAPELLHPQIAGRAASRTSGNRQASHLHRRLRPQRHDPAAADPGRTS